MTQMTNPVFSERAQRRIKRVLKHVIHPLRFRHAQSLPVFVLGYGRSGTTMLIDALEHDMRIEVFQENDPRIARNFLLERERLIPALDRCKAPVAVMKPILDSFAIRFLHSVRADARILWMLRDVDDVVRSALKKFGSAVAESLQRAVRNEPDDSWITRGTPQSTLEILRHMDSAGFSTQDWMALVWWVVNRSLVIEDFSRDSRFRLLRYESLLSKPENTMRGIYEFLELPYRSAAVRWFEAPSPEKPKLSLHPGVRAMCRDLDDEIRRRYQV